MQDRDVTTLDCAAAAPRGPRAHAADIAKGGDGPGLLGGDRSGLLRGGHTGAVETPHTTTCTNMNVESLHAPCTVRKTYVSGLRHTRAEVVHQELGGLGEARTLNQICENANVAMNALRSLGIFEAADVLVDSAPTDGPNGPQADVIIKLVEKKRLTSASTGVSTQGGEGSMDAKVSVLNLFGWAEKLDLNMELGQQSSSAFRLSASRNRWLGSKWLGTHRAQLTADVTKSATSHVKHSSFVEKLLGGSVNCRIGDAGEGYGAHDFSAQLVLRDVCKLERNVASWPILHQRGLSLKSCLSHTFSLSRLDHPFVPTDGSSLKLTTELAGVLPPVGDVRFIKQTLNASTFVPLLHRLSLGLSLNAGLLLPIGSQPMATGGESHISDRFFLGGPSSMWGFRTRGVGPRALRHGPAGEGTLGPRAPRDALGGDLMAVGTAALSVRLPGKLEEANVRAHAFASAGGLTSLPELSRDGSLLKSLRACVGVGLAMPTAVGRLELNLTHVLRRRPEDAVVGKSGVQVGITPGF